MHFIYSNYLYTNFFKNKKYKKSHGLIFATGILWYIIEPILYHHTAIQQNKIKDDSKVYENVYIPRLDDIVFNTLGQMLYMSIKYMR